MSLHILLNSIWIGGVAAILLLPCVKSGANSGDQLYAINLAQFKIHDIVVMNVGFGVIVTGLLFSFFTKWDFFDFYAVLIASSKLL